MAFAIFDSGRINFFLNTSKVEGVLGIFNFLNNGIKPAYPELNKITEIYTPKRKVSISTNLFFGIMFHTTPMKLSLLFCVSPWRHFLSSSWSQSCMYVGLMMLIMLVGKPADLSWTSTSANFARWYLHQLSRPVGPCPCIWLFFPEQEWKNAAMTARCTN